MKKSIISALVSLCLLVPGAFAERYFEIGADVGAGVGQNVMGISDILVEDLVFDLSAINNSLGSGGAKLNLNVDFDLHTNLNVPAFSTGLHFVNKNFAGIRLGKDIFEFLGEGYEVGKTMNLEMDGVVDSFVSVEVPIAFNIGDYALKTKMSYFVPLVFIPTPTATAAVKNDENGNISVVATGVFNIYSIVDMQDVDTSTIVQDITKSAGFDVEFELTYPIIEELYVGGYAHIPVVPGHLNYKKTATSSFELTQESILGSYADSQEVNFSEGIETSDSASESNVAYRVNRPLKFGACAYWQPFGDWFELNGMLGFATRNPFGTDWTFTDYSYLEYAANLNLVGLHVFKLNLTSNYIDKSFNQIIGFGLDLRIAELDMSIGMCSPNFFKSFAGEGLTAKISMNVGF